MNILTITLAFDMILATVQAQNTDTRIDRALAGIRERYGIPAMAAAVVTSDTCYYGVGGTSMVNGTDSVTLRSKFHLGSNTKAVTSFIAAGMKGISFDTKLLELVPELAAEARKEYSDISLGDLLSHNAGIQPFTSGAEYVGLPEMKESIHEKRMQFARILLSRKPIDKGTYSNAGYTLAALMLEKASGKSWEQLVHDSFGSLKLGHFMGFPNKEDIKHPWGHWIEFGEDTLVGKLKKMLGSGPGGLRPLPPDHYYSLRDYTAPAGDISMDIIDYAQFLQLHVEGLSGRDNILQSTDYEKLHFGLKGYSYGWGNAEIADGTKISYHDGSTGTFYCHTVIIPSKRMAITVMANSAETAHVKGINELREILFREFSGQAAPAP